MGQKQNQPAGRKQAKSLRPAPTRRQKLLLAVTIALLALWGALLVTMAVAT